MSQAKDSIYVPYRLSLQSPAIVSTLSGDPNSALTQAFIPGGAIRGALAARLIANGTSGECDEFRRLILSGEVRYLHAYLEASGDRSIPISAALRCRKDDRTSVFDLAAFSGALECDDFDWPEESLVALGDQFGSASGSLTTTIRPGVGSRIHQQRDREKGRSWTKQNGQTEERQGAIFPFEYLESGQSFRGLIQVMPSALESTERIKALLSNSSVLVGRSRRAGYGGEARLEFGASTGREYENLSTATTELIRQGKEFRMLLTSAYIGRHPTTGQVDPTALQVEVERKLPVKVVRSRWNFETVGGFNQKWRLELPQAQAVAAGAVLILNATADISIEALRRLEHKGIGERKVEGFGRVLFLRHSEVREPFGLQHRDHERSDILCSSSSPSEREQALLELLESRIVLSAARKELDQIAHLDLASKVRSAPSNSLLSRLRTLFRGVTNEKSATVALGHLAIWCGNGDDALKDSARTALNTCQLPKGSLLDWLMNLAGASTGDTGWQALLIAAGDSSNRLAPISRRHHLTNEEAAQKLLNKHAAELSVYLMDGVLAALAKRNSRNLRANQ